MEVKYPRIAFAGCAGAGKDLAAIPLYALGYRKHAFGDIIKRQLDPLVREYFGFSAFTEDRTQKARIRRTLESWGEDRYGEITVEYFETLPERAVNTRLVRVREAEEWVRRGGIILLLERPHVGAATPWEAERLQELEDSGLIAGTLHNDRTPEALHAKVVSIAREGFV